MNENLILCHSLEILMLLPAAVFALLPVTNYLRYRLEIVTGAAAISILTATVAGGFLCAHFGWKSLTFVLATLPFFWAAYYWCVNLELEKKLFCFLNAAMLCESTSYHTRMITARLELGRDGKPYLAVSSLICLLLCVLLGILFYRTFRVKIPWFLNEKRFDRLWRYFALIALGLTLFFYHIIPYHAEIILVGRVQSIGLTLGLSAILLIFLFYHSLWQTAIKVQETNRLTLENNLLQMERKRYEELEANIQHLRTLRHDFRHHLLVIDQYAKDGNIPLLREYLQQLEQSPNLGFSHYCQNPSIDAIASHYASKAAKDHTTIHWSLNLPANLKWNPTDLCAIFGNLLENALNAVAEIDEDKRQIRVTSQQLSESMLGISVENPYTGIIELDKNRLPLSHHKDHGFGMTSISSIVSRYHGTMTVHTENGIFSVDILLM